MLKVGFQVVSAGVRVYHERPLGSLTVAEYQTSQSWRQEKCEEKHAN